jgi:hypothetical protein
MTYQKRLRSVKSKALELVVLSVLQFTSCGRMRVECRVSSVECRVSSVECRVMSREPPIVDAEVSRARSSQGQDQRQGHTDF